MVYCLVVNHVSDMLAALADLHPETEAALWSLVRRALEEYADEHGRPPRLAALLAGAPLLYQGQPAHPLGAHGRP